MLLRPMKYISLFIIVLLFLHDRTCCYSQDYQYNGKYLLEKISQIESSKSLSGNLININYRYYSRGLHNSNGIRCDTLHLRNTKVFYSSSLHNPSFSRSDFYQECVYEISKEELLKLLIGFKQNLIEQIFGDKNSIFEDSSSKTEKFINDYDYWTLSISINGNRIGKLFKDTIPRKTKFEILAASNYDTDSEKYRSELKRCSYDDRISDLYKVRDIIDHIINESPIREITNAAKLKNLLKVEEIVTKYPDMVNARDKDGRTPLHYASMNGCNEIAKFLVNKGAKLNVSDDLIGDTPLHQASEYGRINIVKLFLMNGVDVNITTPGGITSLHNAARSGNKEIAELLISKGADVNAKTKNDLTPLHNAVSNGYMDIVTILLSHGADVNAREKTSHRTPLHEAMQGEIHREIVEFLILKGANINAVSKENWTPLHDAVLCKKIELVELLVSRGADVNIKTNHGDTPLRLAIKFKNNAIVEILRTHGAQAYDLYDTTAIGNFEKVISIIAGDPSLVNTKFYYEYTALHVASYWGYKNITEFLIEKGADINARTEYDETPLELAVEEGRFDIVKLLITKGADVNSRNRWNRTPLHNALRAGYTDIADFLRKHGAKE